MVSLGSIAARLSLVVAISSALTLKSRQDSNKNQTTIDPVSTNALSIERISNTSLSLVPSDVTGSDVTGIPPDPFEPLYTCGFNQYRFKFNNYRADVDADEVVASIQKRLQAPVYKSKSPRIPVRSVLYVEGEEWEFHINEEWHQRQPITYGDQYCILSGIFEFANVYIKAGQAKEMTYFDLIVTRNPVESGAQTLTVKLAGISGLSTGNTLSVY